MPKTLVITQHSVVVNGIDPVNIQAQRDKATNFFAQFSNFEGRNFLAQFDWTKIAAHRGLAVTGADLFVAKNLEAVEGHPPNGYTILPNKKPPDGIPEHGVNSIPDPNPTRPSIILRSDPLLPAMTLAHELGHALLNSTGHSLSPNNFMLADPPHGEAFTALQIERMYSSLLLT